jgi:hypothetical protein
MLHDGTSAAAVSVGQKVFLVGSYGRYHEKAGQVFSRAGVVTSVRTGANGHALSPDPPLAPGAADGAGEPLVRVRVGAESVDRAVPMYELRLDPVGEVVDW